MHASIHLPLAQAMIPWFSEASQPWEGQHNDLGKILLIQQAKRWITVFLFNQVGLVRPAGMPGAVDYGKKPPIR